MLGAKCQGAKVPGFSTPGTSTPAPGTQHPGTLAPSTPAPWHPAPWHPAPHLAPLAPWHLGTPAPWHHHLQQLWYTQPTMSMPSLNRRSFLNRVGGGVALAAAGSTRVFGQQQRIERLGMQLYTVRDAMAKDFDGTLAKVAALGYTEVEFAGYFDKTPKQVKASLARHGLTSPSTHIGYDMLGDKLPQVIEASRIIGHRFIVNPWIDEPIRNQPGAWGARRRRSTGLARRLQEGRASSSRITTITSSSCRSTGRCRSS